MSSNVEIKIHPQLCRTHSSKFVVRWPAYLEPKLDGLRGVVVTDSGKDSQSWSRNGKPLWNTGHILAELGGLEWKNYVLDGEFFTEDWNLSLSITKTQSPHPESSRIKYHVWDVIPLQAWMNGRYDEPLRRRKAVLHKGFGNLENIVVVPHIDVANAAEADQAYRSFLEQGYEGGILKDPESPYVLGTRSPGWLKMKPWNDADLTIIGAVEGLGRHRGRLGALVLQGIIDPGGKNLPVRTEVGTGFTDQEREFLWHLHQNRGLLHKVAEIRYQEITKDGSCRFPVFHRLREDK